MASKDYFILALRVIGVLQVIRAIDYLIEAFDVSTRFYRPSVITIGSAYVQLRSNELG